jgi:molybdopterin biosynthesis enzyme
VDLARIECVPDDEGDISSTVLRLKERVGPRGFVFTSGGIGATHDDVTYSALASAFGETTLHPVSARQNPGEKDYFTLLDRRQAKGMQPQIIVLFHQPASACISSSRLTFSAIVIQWHSAGI